MATRRKFERLIEPALYLLRKFSLQRESVAPSVYLAYSIGPGPLATGVYELDAQDDEDALRKATPLFRDELIRIEVWCGSRKVGAIPPMSDEKTDENSIRDSA
jgi:hypothetical protein